MTLDQFFSDVLPDCIRDNPVAFLSASCSIAFVVDGQQKVLQVGNPDEPFVDGPLTSRNPGANAPADAPADDPAFAPLPDLTLTFDANGFAAFLDGTLDLEDAYDTDAFSVRGASELLLVLGALMQTPSLSPLQTRLAGSL